MYSAVVMIIGDSGITFFDNFKTGDFMNGEDGFESPRVPGLTKTQVL